MKKIGLGVLIVGILVISGMALATANGPAEQRVYVLTDNSAVRTILGVKHEFPGAFSTEVSPQLRALSLLGLIKTEPVQIYEITVKPSCDNDGVCEPEEGENPSCADCKNGEEEPPAERSCYPNDQTPWGIEKVYGDTTITSTIGGTGITVAVLDTGVDQDHPDLVGNIKDCVTKVTHFVPDAKNCEDGHGHGTHVSGTILANAGSDGLGIYGVAPEASLIAIKVCDKRGYCYGDDMAAGIYYAVNNEANIISMSIGGDTPDLEVLNAIDYAVSNGLLVVAAAGNDGPDFGSIDYPGAYVKVIAVGAIDSTEAVPDWSSRGINNGDYFIEEKEVEFGTPGVSVESTYNNGCYASGSGTSMATPHVAGLAAKLWQGTASDTRSYLQSIADDIWTTGDDIATGFGLPIAP